MSSAWSCTGFAVRQRRLACASLGLDTSSCLAALASAALSRATAARAAAIRESRLLGVLDAAVARLRQVRHSACCPARRRSRWPGRRATVALAASIDGLLGDERGLLVGDVGLGRRDLGLGLLERDLEVAVVDARQHLPGLHRSLSATSTAAT